MADVEQWVNLTVNDKWKGEGIAGKKEMGLWVNVKFEMAQKKRAMIYVTKKAHGDNAVYLEEERKKRPGFRPREFTKRRFRTDKDGVKIVKTTLTLAGGDKFEFEGEDKAGNKVTADSFLTRRKLYYQIIGMVGAPLPGTGAFESEFWNTGEKIYIEMVEFSPGRTITSLVNLNDENPAVLNAVKADARLQCDKSKKPYGFVTLVVRKNCIPDWEIDSTPNVTFNGDYTLSASYPLFDVADPAEEWYGNITWQDNTGGPPRHLAKARCTRSGDYDIVIDTTGLPQGAPGTLDYQVRIVGIIGMGVSWPTDNLTLVATESYDGSSVAASTVEAVINHEVGHKIGMVPGPEGTHALKEQDSYYDGSGHTGPHCYTGTAKVANFVPGPQDPPIIPPPTPTCTMFGDVRAPTGNFCGLCRISLRKLDLRSRTNVGIRTQF